ncbi:MAG: EAL domain-containing protein [Gammaproteobacteria bacterium]|nr:EAL domain-containing protein [Gammaproteobacteria bacterium]
MNKRTLKISEWGWALISLWSAVILISFFWNSYQVHSLLLDQARAELRTSFFKDQTFRLWAAKHGGVYVPVTETQKPDPYVAFIPERDVVTPSGKVLTLINPALMVRQFNELAKKQFGVVGHLSSLRPINPINRADDWEQMAYHEFEKGIKEVTSISAIDGKPYLRLIRPTFMATPCLKCHEAQGYKEGDLGGSVSVSVSLEPIEEMISEQKSVLIVGHLLFWLLGLGGLVYTQRQIAHRISEREAAFHKLEESKNRTRSIVSSSLDAIITIDRHGQVTGWNEQATAIFGWSEDQIMGRSLSETIIPEQHRIAHNKGLTHAVKSREGRMLNRRVEITGLTQSGDEVPLEISITEIIVEGEIAFSAFIRDISEQKRALEKIEQNFISQQLIASVLELSLEPIPFEQRLEQILQQILSTSWLRLQSKGALFIVGEDNQTLEMTTQHGLSSEEIIACETATFGDYICNLVVDSRELINKKSTDQDYTKIFSHTLVHGHYCLPILSGKNLLGVLSLYLDKNYSSSKDQMELLSSVTHTIGGMIQRNIAERSLLHNAFHDSLTGLPNRALFIERLKHSMAHQIRHPESNFAILFLDLDHFKYINDSLGHSVGDQLLKDVAERLQACSRPEDTVARLGGDEFTLLLEGVTSEFEVSNIADRIHYTLRQPFDLDEREMFAPCSIGVAFGNTDYHSPVEIIRDADTAMYRAKAMSGSQTIYFDKQMHASALNRLTMDTNLRRALEKRKLLLFYQPIVSSESGAIVGFESLVRWPLDDGTMISPAEFIPLAEETGLIHELGLWVLHEACAQLLEWHSSFPELSDLYITVNISGKQLQQNDLFDNIETILQSINFNPENLRLEITESNLLANTSSNNILLNKFKDHGYHFYIDDFGTGYSSLSYLHSFPFDALKIDQSFVQNITRGKEHIKMIETIVAIAHNFNMQVIAEGVDTPEKQSLLHQLGCERLQGFLFSKALPPEEITKILSKQGLKL